LRPKNADQGRKELTKKEGYYGKGIFQRKGKYSTARDGIETLKNLGHNKDGDRWGHGGRAGEGRRGKKGGWV